MRPAVRQTGEICIRRSSTMPAARSVMTIVVGRRACVETQRRETATRTPPADDARVGGPLEALDRDDAEPSTPADPGPELAEGVAVPDDPA
jgi:hypothetical protein